MSSGLSWLHHDGSELYVSDAAPELGQTIQVRLRVHRSIPLDRVTLRAVHDGEPRLFAASQSEDDGNDIWWTADLLMQNPRQNYRWWVKSEAFGTRWLNAEGIHHRDVSDAGDFVVAAYPEVPRWSRRNVVYQIFPDRFAKSEHRYPAPNWAQPRDWNDHPKSRERATAQEWFGGDLWGVAEKLDYLQDLGVETVYLTPFFPAGSTHRYDAQSFDEVDPLLGGDQALINLSDATHRRGMRLAGDITLNHCGVNHEWFKSAVAGDETKRGWFYFNEKLPFGYECWFGVRSLPKFNYASDTLRERLISGSASVVRKWLLPPYNLDGWRVDVANMSGRLGDTELTHDVARMTRTVVRECGEDKLLIAEHFHDAGRDLDGDGWQGAMAYTTFSRPVLAWLVSDEFLDFEKEKLAPISRTNASEMVATINDFASRMPWRSRVASWTLLGSHDTARVRTVVGTEEKQLAALGLLIGLPGSPMIFMGDEQGAVGWWGEDSRTTMDWNQIEQSKPPIFRAYQNLIALRRSSDALANGGLRWLAVVEDLVLFERESKAERLLFAVSRAAGSIALGELGANQFDLVYGDASISGDRIDCAAAGVTIWRLS